MSTPLSLAAADPNSPVSTAPERWIPGWIRVVDVLTRRARQLDGR